MKIFKATLLTAAMLATAALGSWAHAEIAGRTDGQVMSAKITAHDMSSGDLQWDSESSESSATAFSGIDTRFELIQSRDLQSDGDDAMCPVCNATTCSPICGSSGWVCSCGCLCK